MEKRLEELKATSLQQILKDPTKLKKFYREFFDDDVCGHCPDIITARYKALFTLTAEKMKAMQSRVLKMQPDKAINTFMSNVLPQNYWTKDNITDEVAIQLIEAGHGSSFINPQDLQLAKNKLAGK